MKVQSIIEAKISIITATDGSTLVEVKVGHFGAVKTPDIQTVVAAGTQLYDALRNYDPARSVEESQAAAPLEDLPGGVD